MKPPDLPQDYHQLAARIKAWGVELGFQAVGIAGIELPEDEQHLLDWLQRGDHGDMAYMAQHGSRRGRPAELLPGTLRAFTWSNNVSCASDGRYISRPSALHTAPSADT